jgi:hypothetical protein
VVFIAGVINTSLTVAVILFGYPVLSLPRSLAGILAILAGVAVVRKRRAALPLTLTLAVGLLLYVLVWTNWQEELTRGVFVTDWMRPRLPIGVYLAVGLALIPLCLALWRSRDYSPAQGFPRRTRLKVLGWCILVVAVLFASVDASSIVSSFHATTSSLFLIWMGYRLIRSSGVARPVFATAAILIAAYPGVWRALTSIDSLRGLDLMGLTYLRPAWPWHIAISMGLLVMLAGFVSLRAGGDGTALPVPGNSD